MATTWTKVVDPDPSTSFVPVPNSAAFWFTENLTSPNTEGWTSPTTDQMTLEVLTTWTHT